MAASNYFTNTLEFLAENFPKIPLEHFDGLIGVTNPLLNIMFDIVGKCYLMVRENTSTVLSALLSLYNFYLRTLEAKSILSLSIGFMDMVNSIFGFGKIPDMFNLVFNAISKTFKSIGTYFLRPESSENIVQNFWNILDNKDPRSILNIVYELTGISSTCALVYNLHHAHVSKNSISGVVQMVTEHYLNPHSEVRIKLRSITEAIARIIDYICMNYEYMLKGELHNISWKLPGPLQFENDYSDFCSDYEKYMVDPLYLETINMTLSNFGDRAKNLIKRANDEIVKTNIASVRNNMVRYLQVLTHHHQYLCNQLSPNNTKPQPLSIVLCGPAGCGKSSIAISIGKLMQTIVGRNPDEDKIKNRGGDPKFEPSITAMTEVIVLDDFGNDTTTPIMPKDILDVVNVTKEVIPKASVEEKNKYKYSNIGTIFTTNDRNCGINQISTVSYDSILRRFGIVVHIEPKAEYCLPSSNVLNRNHPYLQGSEARDDIYNISIEFPKTVDHKKNGRVEIVYNLVQGWKRQDMSDLKACILYLRSHFKAEWDKNVEQHKHRNSPERICNDCHLEHMICVCKYLKPEALNFQDMDYFIPQDMYFSFDNIRERYMIFDSWGQIWIDLLLRKISLYYFSSLLYMELYSIYKWIYDNRFICAIMLINYIISSVMSGLFFLVPWIIVILFAVFRNYNIKIYIPWIIFITCIYYHYQLGAVFLSVILAFFVTHDLKKQIVRREAERKYFEASRSIREYYYSRMSLYFIVGSSLSFVSFLLSLRLMKYLFSKKFESRRDITEDPYLPDFKPTNSDNNTRYHFVAQPDEKAQTSSRKEAIDFIGRKMLVARISTPDCVLDVRAIPCGSEIIIPAHAIPNHGRFSISICADFTKRTSMYKDTDVGQDSYRLLKDRSGNYVDAALLHLSNMPTQPDLLRFFTRGAQPVSGPGQELYKHENGSYELVDLRLTTPGMFDINQYRDPYRGLQSNYPAIKCVSQYDTSFEGMCGSPIISEDSNCILGFHIAGNATKTWYGLRLTADMIEEARGRLMAESKYFVSHPVKEKIVVERSNGVPFSVDDKSSSPVISKIGKEMSPIEEIGELYKGDDLYNDRAEKHYFKNRNPRLIEAFGPVESAPPEFPNGDAQINSVLKKLHEPKFNLPIDLMDRAVIDYLEGSTPDGINFNSIINSFKSNNKHFFSVRTIEEAMRGDGTGVIRGINNASSAGWIYGGKKTRHYNMEVDGDPMEIRDLLPHIRKDLEYQEGQWRNGIGTYDPFKRCSKTNELLPLEKSKEKTRSFYGNDMTFFINMMRAVIPHKHILRKNMGLSECFVGITPQSKQWRELKQYLTRDGVFTRFVCGDFTGYDTQLPKALLEKSAWVLMEMARRGGMSSTDLQFLRGALSSVVSPTVIWQGHILRLANGQPSGQPLTVELNSIMNSILMRMVYFTIMDEFHPRYSHTNYRSLVSLATYGDDNILGVDSKIPEYNHTRIKEVFARWGISYTMADKNADSVPYQTIEEVSFLKRSFANHCDLGVVAPIEYQSIVKGFYYWVRSKNTPLNFPQQFRELVKSQVREAILHGEEFYEKFCHGILLLQKGSQEQGDPEFEIKWNGFDLPSYQELIDEVKEAY